MNNKLFVANLPWSVTEGDLMSLFGEVGEVRAVKIPTRPEDGKSRGFAFVEMGSPDEAQWAITRLNGMRIQNRDLVVTLQDERRAAQSAPTMRRPGFDSPRPAPQEDQPMDHTRLFVRNLPPSMTNDDLRAWFEQVGPVRASTMPLDRETGMPRGFAFVEMESEDGAAQVIAQLNQAAIDSYTVQITYQDPNRTRSSSGPRPPRGGQVPARSWY